jgi:hypothetical protein
VFDKSPQQVLQFCAIVGGEEYFFECVVTIERNMFKKQIEFKKEYSKYFSIQDDSVLSPIKKSLTETLANNLLASSMSLSMALMSSSDSPNSCI